MYASNVGSQNFKVTLVHLKLKKKIPKPLCLIQKENGSVIQKFFIKNHFNFMHKYSEVHYQSA